VPTSITGAVYYAFSIDQMATRLTYLCLHYPTFLSMLTWLVPKVEVICPLLFFLPITLVGAELAVFSALLLPPCGRTLGLTASTFPLLCGISLHVV
jgi:hypothetical protein